MSVLVIAVSRARRLCGRASGLSSDGRAIFGPVRILATASARVARAHGNPTCSPALPFGHPPAGSYVIAESLPPRRPHRRARRYGRLGALVLAPTGGQAAAAGRRIVLHGGPPDPKGRLRPTRGGLRVADRDLVALLEAVNAANAVGDPFLSVDIVEIDATPTSTGSADRPGGRRHNLARRSRVDIARRKFLGAAALLLGAMAAGAVGCSDDTPSYCRASAADPADGGVDASSGGCLPDYGGDFTGGGGFG